MARLEPARDLEAWEPRQKEVRKGYLTVPVVGEYVTVDDWNTAKSAQVYQTIKRGEEANEWTAAQLKTVNELRLLYELAIATATNSGSSDGVGGGCDVFRGAHIVLSDGAQWYYHWVKRIAKHPGSGDERWSSHYDKSRKAPQSMRYPKNMESKEAQFELYFPVASQNKNWGCLLFGRYQKKDDRGVYVTQARTWFQVEGHAATRKGAKPAKGEAKEDTRDKVGHVTDWMQYAATGNNVGSFGRSPYVESNPVFFEDNVPPPSSPISDNDVEGVRGLWGKEPLTPVCELGEAEPTGGTFCVQCHAVHSWKMSLVNAWHRCTQCGVLYCPSCGKKLKGGGWIDHKRDCAKCGGRTEFLYRRV